ncbi:MAG: dihydroneopterin aldolase [Cytophagales bacterium]|nr:dihydroneopterin aldolase [Bernardetiaceae bacterium]MDW8203711.1 dihydroneopterin aldolase [Cytophagales bacterium]
MSCVDTIALRGLIFYAYHGYYAEERALGNRYGVDIEVRTDLRRAAASDQLADTINYETLYAIAQEAVVQPAQLLEHIGERIAKQIFEQFAGALQVKITVRKYNPPIGGICRAAEIILQRKRHDYLSGVS